MADRFDPLPDEADVFRFAEPTGGHLPEGSRLPKPDWLAPTEADKKEAAARGRSPGLSAWQHGLTTPAVVRRLTKRPKAAAFRANVGEMRSAPAQVDQFEGDVHVLHDPADAYEPTQGWDAHAIIEGLHRPDDKPRGPYRALRARLVALFEPID